MEDLTKKEITIRTESYTTYHGTKRFMAVTPDYEAHVGYGETKEEAIINLYKDIGFD